MLNGAKLDGKSGSANRPGRVTCEKLPSKTSILPALKLAAYNNGPKLLLPSARPLYTAPDPELSAMMTALGPAELFQPEIVPSSLAKRKRAGWPPDITNADVGLKT